MRYTTALFATCLLSLGCTAAIVAQPYVAGEVYHDAARAIEYHAGDAPFVLSVPHGGALAPDSLPDRDCEGCSYLRDSYTQELAREFILAYRARTGCSPHVVINLLHRRKLDMNRDLPEATDSVAAKEPLWRAYHAFVDSAKAAMLRAYGGGLFLDLHGHGHEKQRIELGYLLSASSLRKSDSVLNTATYRGYSAIRALAGNNHVGLTHAELLRGPYSFGTLLSTAGYPAVPSMQDPFPLEGDEYYDGGYNTAAHGSRKQGRIDAMQMELYSAIRFDAAQRRAFADSLAGIVLRFIDMHYHPGFLATPCVVLGGEGITAVRPVDARPWPNPADTWLWLPAASTPRRLRLYTLLGTLLRDLDGTVAPLYIGDLAPGMYLLLVETRDAPPQRHTFLKR